MDQLTQTEKEIFKKIDNEILKVIDAKLLGASPTQPRKVFNEREMQELTESVKENGVIQPPLVRVWPEEYKKPKGEPEYEIVDGERRVRAAIASGRLTVICLVVEMTTEQVMETQMIGHLHRADIHPMEEAEAYERLLSKGTYDAKELAAKVGKSASHIYQRLSLLKLIDPARELLWSGKLNAHQGMLIARCLPAFQERILKNFAHEIEWGSLTASRLFAFIETNQYCILKKAPFRTDDENLVPAAGSCAACPKRSGNNTDLFSDVGDDNTCTDRACYTLKLRAHIAKAKQEVAEKTGGEPVQISTDYNAKKGVLANDAYEFTSKGDKNAVLAVVVQGPESELGKKKYIKVKKEKKPSAGETARQQITPEETEANERHENDKIKDALRMVRSFTPKVDMPMEIVDHIIEVQNINSFDRVCELLECPAEHFTAIEKLVLSILAEEIDDCSFGIGADLDDENNAYYKKQFGVDILGRWKSMDKDFQKELKAIRAAAQKKEPAPAVEPDDKPKGKARNSKLRDQKKQIS